MKSTAEMIDAPIHSSFEFNAYAIPAITYSLPIKIPTPTPANKEAMTNGLWVCCSISIDPNIIMPALATPAINRITITISGCVTTAIAKISRPVTNAAQINIVLIFFRPPKIPNENRRLPTRYPA